MSGRELPIFNDKFGIASSFIKLFVVAIHENLGPVVQN